MIKTNLKPWQKITRHGIPPFRVVRRPIVTGGHTFAVGDEICVDHFCNRIRMRQMYEQRRIEPVGPVEPLKQVPAQAALSKPVVAQPAAADPLLSVATPIVESDVEQRARANSKSKPMRGYTPSRKRK